MKKIGAQGHNIIHTICIMMNGEEHPDGIAAEVNKIIETERGSSEKE